jgi:hypothetical protein
MPCKSVVLFELGVQEVEDFGVLGGDFVQSVFKEVAGSFEFC